MSLIKTFTPFPCLIMIITLTLALAQLSNAQNSPQDYVDAHNAARAAVGVGNIEWNDEVATYAQQYANQRVGDCALQHSGGPYGENIAQGSDNSLTGTAAVQMWVNEKADYDYSTNTCASGQNFTKACIKQGEKQGSFTLLISAK